MAAAVPWTIDKEETFVELLWNYPCIWDVSWKHYKHDYVRKAAVEKIAETLGRTPQSIMSKLAGLRSQLSSNFYKNVL